MNSWKMALGALAVIGLAACSNGGGSPASTAGGEPGMARETDAATVLNSVDTVMLGDFLWGTRSNPLLAQRVETDCVATTCTIAHSLLGSDTITFEQGVGIFGASTAVEQVAEKGSVPIMRTSPTETELLGQEVSITAYGAWLDNS